MIEREREIDRDSAAQLIHTFARISRVMRHSFKLSHAIHQTFARIRAAGAGHDARPIKTIAREGERGVSVSRRETETEKEGVFEEWIVKERERE